MVNIANELWNDFISLVFPETCLACNRLLVKGEDHLCTFCRHDLPIGAAATHHNLLKNKFVHEPRITYVKAFLPFKKFGITQKLLHHLKYRGNYELGVMLGKWFGEALVQDKDFPHFDWVVPVPLHRRKLSIRGYNQSEAIAEGLQFSTGIEMKRNVLTRVRHTATQTRKRRIERWENVEDIFQVTMDEDLKDKKVLIVDDVLTTGSTLASCSSAFIKAGVEQVGICTLAYA